MKEVIAIIRMNKMHETKEALIKAGFPGFNAVKVVGRGRQAMEAEVVDALNQHPEDASEVLPLLAHVPRLIPKRWISLVVPDELVKEVVNTIIKVNQTRNPGDGKVFVVPVLDSIRIRTRERGNFAIDEMGSGMFFA
ncbi:P-II family nitrogen regulator [Roseofilum sp. BLCC_M154]|uniref:P-II family nitrogen regulator n=1 Tax=Roseofilum acuticapitatum BLCC-M154 TaxID=3022444 RepID=A0ABT7AY73_9CYAN|nr:P-II family nitrogen regulator [Roseofilum acuticapitatum]MDJ1171023.1 P-II family nitrogen regulator [Roseofilum acuticapitatum BLCC-M154]